MSSDYIEYIKEYLDQFGNVSFKKMFGGFAVYAQKKCIGIVLNNELYLKANDLSLRIYHQNDSTQFSYINGKTQQAIKVNWWKINDAIMEDNDLLQTCYNAALDSAKLSKKSAQSIPSHTV